MQLRFGRAGPSTSVAWWIPVFERPGGRNGGWQYRQILPIHQKRRFCSLSPVQRADFAVCLGIRDDAGDFASQRKSLRGRSAAVRQVLVIHPLERATSTFPQQAREPVAGHDGKIAHWNILAVSETAVRVILAEKRLLFREGLIALCDRKGPLEIAAAADEVDALLRVCEETEADVLICGDSLRGGECTDVASRLRADGSSLPMLLITSRPEEHYITSCLSAGIVGFITIDDPSETLFKAVEALVNQDMAWLSPSVSSCILPRYRTESPGERLTEREVEVLKHASLGKTNDQISEMLHVAPGTVRNYLSSIYKKVDVGSRAEAIAWAWQSGLVRRRPRP